MTCNSSLVCVSGGQRLQGLDRETVLRSALCEANHRRPDLTLMIENVHFVEFVEFNNYIKYQLDRILLIA